MGRDPIDLASQVLRGLSLRRADASLRRCLDEWDALGVEELDELARVGRSRWLELLPPRLTSDDRRLRIGAAEVAIRSGEPRLLALASRAMSIDSELVLGAAGLSEVAAETLLKEMQSASDPAIRAELARLGASLPAHRDAGVARAVLLATEKRAPSDDALRSWFESADDACVMLLRRELASLPGERGAERALGLLADQRFAATAAERLANASSDAEREVIARRAHLTVRPPRRGRLSSGSASGGIVRISATVIAGSDQRSLRQGATRIVASFGSDAVVSDALLPTLADDDAATRLIASRRAMALPDFVFDVNPAIARSAMLRLASSGVKNTAEGRALLNLASRSPVPQVRSIAERSIESADPWNPNSAASRLAARRRLERDGVAFLGDLCRRLHPDDVVRCYAGLQLVKRLGLVAPCRDAVRGVLRRTLAENSGESARLCASAISCLDQLKDGKYLDVYRLALRHADSRVRANALEAIARVEGGDQLIECKDDEHHRVRANTFSVISLAEPELSARGLAELLGASDEMPVRAGLWAAERTLGRGRHGESKVWGEVAARVTALTRADSKPIRGRALRTARRSLLAQRAVNLFDGRVVTGAA